MRPEQTKVKKKKSIYTSVPILAPASIGTTKKTKIKLKNILSVPRLAPAHVQQSPVCGVGLVHGLV